MTTEFISNTSIPNSTTTTTTPTTLDHHSPAGLTALISLVALFLICSFIIFSQHRLANHQSSQPTATPIRPLSAATLPPPGLDATAVASLPLVRCARGRSGEWCAVCLVEYVGEEMVKVIPGCRHGFHPACIDKWLLSRGSCPVCRRSDIWGRWRDEVFVGVRRCNSCDRCCLEVEESGGEMGLRRICSV